MNTSRSRSRKNRKYSQGKLNSPGKIEPERTIKKRNNETEESFDALEYNKPRMLSP